MRHGKNTKRLDKNYNKVNTFTKSDGTTTDPGGETLTELVEVHFPNAVENIKKSYTSNNKMKKTKH